MRPVAQNQDQGVRGCVYGSIHSHKTSMSTHTFYAAPAVLDAALHALSACTTSSTQDTMQSPLVPATIGAVCARGGQHDTRVLCFAILLSPDMHQNVKASSRRSRHHVWEASQPRSHRSCAVHGLESRRLGAAGISNAPDRYRGPEYSQPQRVARPPRVLYTVVHQRSSYTQDAGLHLAQRHWDGTQTMRSREAYTESRSHACLHATALLQIAGAQPHAVGTHIRSSDHIRGDGPSMRAGRGVGLSVSHASGRSARAVIQSSVQEQSVPLTLSVTSACHSAPVRVLDGSATGVSHTGSLCVERLVPTFGSQSHTRIHTQTRKHSAGAHVPPSSVFVTGGLGALGSVVDRLVHASWCSTCVRHGS